MDGVTRGVVKKCYVLKCYIFYCVSGVDRGRGALDCISVQKEARERCKDVQAWGGGLGMKSKGIKVYWRKLRDNLEIGVRNDRWSEETEGTKENAFSDTRKPGFGRVM